MLVIAKWVAPNVLRNVRAISKTSLNMSDNLFVHRDTPEDNPNIPFEFTEENKKTH